MFLALVLAITTTAALAKGGGGGGVGHGGGGGGHGGGGGGHASVSAHASVHSAPHVSAPAAHATPTPSVKSPSGFSWFPFYGGSSTNSNQSDKEKK